MGKPFKEVMAEQERFDALVSLRRERSGETLESAIAWAKEFLEWCGATASKPPDQSELKCPNRLVRCECAACVGIEDPEMVHWVEPPPKTPEPPQKGTFARARWDARGGPAPPIQQRGFA